MPVTDVPVGPVDPVAPVLPASLAHHLHYDRIDLVFGNYYSICSNVLLKPTFGLHYAYIKQHVHFHEINKQTCSLGDSLVITDFDKKLHFQGIGPEFNLAGYWDIGCEFNLFASGGASVLYGHF